MGTHINNMSSLLLQGRNKGDPLEAPVWRERSWNGVYKESFRGEEQDEHLPSHL